MDIILQGILYLIAFIVIIGITYILTKYLAKKAQKTVAGKNMKIIETLSLGLDARLYLVKVAEKYIVISYSGKRINNITELSSDDISNDLSESVDTEKLDFSSTLSKYFNKSKVDNNYGYEGSVINNSTSTNKIKENIKKLREISKKDQKYKS